ncbi:hypothetical protein B5X24_HaOG201804 [Helicoverpa armigera]|nr:hypothetical protein B5X24_HaOG201804 [Helicoverpa armigera]
MAHPHMPSAYAAGSQTALPLNAGRRLYRRLPAACIQYHLCTPYQSRKQTAAGNQKPRVPLLRCSKCRRHGRRPCRRACVDAPLRL